MPDRSFSGHVSHGVKSWHMSIDCAGRFLPCPDRSALNREQRFVLIGGTRRRAGPLEESAVCDREVVVIRHVITLVQRGRIRGRVRDEAAARQDIRLDVVRKREGFAKKGTVDKKRIGPAQEINVNRQFVIRLQGDRSTHLERRHEVTSTIPIHVSVGRNRQLTHSVYSCLHPRMSEPAQLGVELGEELPAGALVTRIRRSEKPCDVTHYDLRSTNASVSTQTTVTDTACRD